MTGPPELIAAASASDGVAPSTEGLAYAPPTVETHWNPCMNRYLPAGRPGIDGPSVARFVYVEDDVLSEAATRADWTANCVNPRSWLIGMAMPASSIQARSSPRASGVNW